MSRLGTKLNPSWRLGTVPPSPARRIPAQKAFEMIDAAIVAHILVGLLKSQPSWRQTLTPPRPEPPEHAAQPQ
jgi:hypothetical protein